jgi:hypothetical protein
VQEKGTASVSLDYPFSFPLRSTHCRGVMFEILLTPSHPDTFLVAFPIHGAQACDRQPGRQAPDDSLAGGWRHHGGVLINHHGAFAVRSSDWRAGMMGWVGSAVRPACLPLSERNACWGPMTGLGCRRAECDRFGRGAGVRHCATSCHSSPRARTLSRLHRGGARLPSTPA